MDLQFSKLPICVGDVTLKVARGHFATSHSHINYLIDVTSQKASLNEASAVAQQLADRHLSSTMIDAILCLDGTRVIGTCLARRLTQAGYRSINEGRDLYVLRVELDGGGKILFRDNARSMVEGKNVLILMASVTTGETARRSMESIRYYSGKVAGIAAIYSCLPEVDGMPVAALYDCSDLPDYASYPPRECPMCRSGLPLDAVVNSFGYSKL
jgi:orotate phosphoribosyltransferase